MVTRGASKSSASATPNRMRLKGGATNTDAMTSAMARLNTPTYHRPVGLKRGEVTLAQPHMKVMTKRAAA